MTGASSSSDGRPGTSDRIEIRGLRVFGHHGVLASEQRDGQTFVLDVVLEVDLAAAARSDDLADTVHYGEMAERLAHEVATTRYDLIEALAGHLADVALGDERVHAVEVRVGKPQAPIDADLDEVAVTIRRGR
jgi:7,8-dihydroneopterin aldolase/epimerase/oxygenase